MNYVLIKIKKGYKDRQTLVPLVGKKSYKDNELVCLHKRDIHFYGFDGVMERLMVVVAAVRKKIYKKSLLSYGLFLTLIILLPSYIQKFQVYLFIFF